MIHRARRVFAISSIAVGLVTIPVQAQEKPPDKPNRTAPTQTPEGLSVNITNQGTFSLTDLSNVVGQQSGSTVNFGLKFSSLVKYRKGKHRFNADANLQVALTQIPLLNGFIKTADTLASSAGYFYDLRPSLAAILVVHMMTPTMRGTDLRPAVSAYQVQYLSGSSDTVMARSFTMTEPFRPLRLSAIAGPEWTPFASPKIDSRLTAVVGVLRTFADNQFALTDDPTTPAIEVRELQSSTMAGLGAKADVFGLLLNKSLSYDVNAMILVPLWLRESVVQTIPDASPLQQATVDLALTLGLEISSWASINYQFSASRQPQIIDQWQIRHGLNLSFGASYKKTPPKPKVAKGTPKTNPDCSVVAQQPEKGSP